MILLARATQGGRGGEVRWRQFRCVAREGRFVALSDFVRDERAEVFADDDVPCSRSLGVGELQVQVRFQHLSDILEVILRFARVPFDVGESTKARAPLRERSVCVPPRGWARAPGRVRGSSARPGAAR